MTDPTGICFLSYKRERSGEARLLVEALRDHGIPTWQDVSDLGSGITEAEITAVLAEPSTSSSVMLVTPEVASSDVIRKVEAPRIIGRVLDGDGFYVVPIAAGGMGYGGIGPALGPGIGSADMAAFNVLKSDDDPFSTSFASSVARRTLGDRLAAITASAPASDPLTLQVSTRAPLPKMAGITLRADLRHRFAGRHANPGAWSDHIVPAFSAIAHALASRASGRSVEMSGFPALPVAVALGAAFPALWPVKASWLQDVRRFGGSSERWGLDVPAAPCGFRTRTVPRSASADDLALLVSVTNDVSQDFNVSTTALRFRAVVTVEPQNRAVTPPPLGAGEALDLSILAIGAVRTAVAQMGSRGTLHLFLAVPAGLAFLIGQQLNTFGTVQTYEHDPSMAVPYVAAATLHPSNP